MIFSTQIRYFHTSGRSGSFLIYDKSNPRLRNWQRYLIESALADTHLLLGFPLFRHRQPVPTQNHGAFRSSRLLASRLGCSGPPLSVLLLPPVGICVVLLPCSSCLLVLLTINFASPIVDIHMDHFAGRAAAGRTLTGKLGLPEQGPHPSDSVEVTVVVTSPARPLSDCHCKARAANLKATPASLRVTSFHFGSP